MNSSFEYIQGKRRFESAITAARGVGRSDEEIARATGLTLEMIEAVAGKQRDITPLYEPHACVSRRTKWSAATPLRQDRRIIGTIGA